MQLVREAQGSTLSTGIVRAQVTGYGTSNATFRAKLLDVTDAVTGPEFEVYAKTLDGTATPGVVDLSLAFPRYVIGNEILIEYRTGRRPGVSGLWPGWWARDVFMGKC